MGSQVEKGGKIVLLVGLIALVLRALLAQLAPPAPRKAPATHAFGGGAPGKVARGDALLKFVGEVADAKGRRPRGTRKWPEGGRKFMVPRRAETRAMQI